MIRFKNQIIIVVQKSGQNQGAVSSLNIKSKPQMIAMFIAKLKAPKVSILMGRLMMLIIGFIKELIKPSITAKNKIICHCSVKGIPKKLESGCVAISTFGTNIMANQNPVRAAIILKINFLIIFTN